MPSKTQKQEEVTMTASELAELVGKDPKSVRAYLRREFARDPEQKNARWTINAAVRDAAVAHFAPKEEAAKAS